MVDAMGFFHDYPCCRVLDFIWLCCSSFPLELQMGFSRHSLQISCSGVALESKSWLVKVMSLVL